ncbi:MAG: hypothetical protein IPK72_16190 [Candidatus Eisenbacteria bacterium]|nr:hypothetical protein [Candidatus Eisenbacteria bacterium]
MSATLGDMDLAASFLRPSGRSKVHQVVSSGGGAEVQLQVRGYVGDHVDLSPDISAHLYKVLRGGRHLVFINRKSQVEAYSAALRDKCVRTRVPNEFLPHHGSLSKELREDAEQRLRAGELPTTVICSSTLELGIDIGNVESVAQVGGPIGVASMRQRLGRSGRRGGASVLRTYVEEPAVTPKTAVPDLLRWELVETTAMVELLIARWIEPPGDRALHLSTLVQQTLSVIAEYGGRRAEWIWEHLCGGGPFQLVSRSMFAALLRALGQRDLVVQTSDGVLLLGVVGERLVNHYEFYTAFATPEEYRIEHEGRALGAIPIYHTLLPGGMITFAGKRWVVLAINEEQGRIEVRPGPAGPVPHFFGGGAPVHDRVRQEMFRLYVRPEVPRYLDGTARTLLSEGRGHFHRMKLQERAIVEDGFGCWCSCGVETRLSTQSSRCCGYET